MAAFCFFGLISIMILCVALWPLLTEDHSLSRERKVAFGGFIGGFNCFYEL